MMLDTIRGTMTLMIYDKEAQEEVENDDDDDNEDVDNVDDITVKDGNANSSVESITTMKRFQFKSFNKVFLR